jgi:hypothetical protein
MIEEFYKLKIFQVLKGDEEYQSVLEKRIKRLQNWKAKVTAKKLKKEFDVCTKLTRDAHRTAEKLRKVRNEFVEAFPKFETIAEALDLVVALLDERLKNSDVFKEWKKYKGMEDTLRVMNLSKSKAREIVLEALEGKVKEDISMLELVRKRTQNYDSLMLAQIKSDVVLLHTGFQSFASLIGSCPPIVETLDLYRGLLYMGIVNIEGGKLDQKALWDRAVSIGENAIGFVPVIGNIVGAVKMTTEIIKSFQELKGVDTPDIIDNAQYVEIFIGRYQSVLRSWMAVAQVYITTTKSLSKSLKQYHT